MIIIKQPLTIDELGQLAGLLYRYLVELNHEACDGRAIDESPADTLERNNAIYAVSNCLKVLREDLYTRLYSL